MNQAGAAKVKILFLCTGNSCRSQMAEGWAKKLKADTIDAYSAGIEKLIPYRRVRDEIRHFIASLPESL